MVTKRKRVSNRKGRASAVHEAVTVFEPGGGTFSRRISAGEFKALRTMSSEADRGLLLDTDVSVWYIENDADRFSRRIEPRVERAVRSGLLSVSAISIWELAMLESRRRLELSLEIRTWVRQALSFPGVRLRGLSPSVAIDSTRLPGEPHPDPADRILIATARQLGAAIVTCDERILRYASEGHVRVVDARP